MRAADFLDAPEVASQGADAPKSVRNNNPGNIRSGNGFAQYATPEDGLDALRHDLSVKVSGQSRAMKGKFGANYTPSITTLINTWAPPNENNTKNYIAKVARDTGIDPDATLTVADIDRILPSIIHMEGGQKAVDYFGGQQTADAGNIMSDAVGAAGNTSDTLPVAKALSQLVSAGPKGPDDPTGTVKKDIQLASLDPGVKLGAPTDWVGPGEIEVAKLGSAADFLDAPEENVATPRNTAPDPRGKPSNLGQRIASTEQGRLLLGLGEGITRAGIGAVQAIADTVGAKDTSRAAAELIDQGKANREKFGAEGAVGGFIGDVAPYALTANPATALGRAGIGAGIGAAQAILRPQGTDDKTARLDPITVGTSAALGAALPATVDGVGLAAKGVGKALVPDIGLSAAKLAQRAKDFGVDVSMQQLSPTRFRNTVQKVSQEAPLSGYGNFETRQTSQFNKALARTIGEDAESISPEVLNRALGRIGETYDNLLNGKIVQAADTSALDDVVNSAKDSVSNDTVNIIQRNVDKIRDNIADGVINGEKLASVRSQLGKTIARTNGEAKPFLQDLAEQVDDLINTGLSGDERSAFGAVRRQYRNIKTLQPLLEKAANDGQLNPTQIMQRVAASPYISGSRKVLGEDDLVDLARIGKEFLPKQGGSDTFQKSAITLGAYGAAGGAALGNIGLTAAGLAANRFLLQGANQSQKLVNKAIQNALERNATPTGIIKAVKASGAEAEDISEAVGKITRGAGQRTNAPDPRSSPRIKIDVKPNNLNKKGVGQ